MQIFKISMQHNLNKYLFLLTVNCCVLIGWMAWNLASPSIEQRGFIGCINGIMWAKNIELTDTFTLPEGEYLLNLNGKYCNDYKQELGY